MDIANGFYRIAIRSTGVPKLGIAYPGYADKPLLVAFPITLPMGWTNSPTLFCSATETIADLANDAILKWRNPAPHQLDSIASTPCSGTSVGSIGAAHDSSNAVEPSSHTQEAVVLPALTALLPPLLPVPESRDPFLTAPRRHPLAVFDVFVDDFIAAAQGDDTRLNRVRRILFTAINQVFRPLDGADTPLSPGTNLGQKAETG